MIRKISVITLFAILIFGTLCSPIFAEKQLPNSGGSGSGRALTVTEPINIEQTPHVTKPGPGRSIPVTEPIPNESTPEIKVPEVITPKNLEAVPTTSTIIINGESVSFEAYRINDNNYFKLRDLAYVLSEEKTVEVVEAEVIKDITTVQFTAYLVNDNIYFKLRDLGAAFDFGVDWDRESNTVIIDTTKGYTTD